MKRVTFSPNIFWYFLHLFSHLMLPKVPEICSRGTLHNWKLDRRKPHWPKNQLVPRLEEEAGVHLRPNWLPPSPVFVACTSIYQRGEAVGCIRGLPKHCTVVGNNCVRGNGCPKSSTVGSQPHIAQTFRHRSSSSEDQLIFLLFLPCIDWTWYFGSHFSLKSYGICHVWLKHYICGEMDF